MDNATKEILESANELFLNGDFYKSEKILLKVIKSDPGNVEALEKLGTLSLWKNNTEMAESYLKEAINKKSWFGNIWPFNAQLKYRLASTYFRFDRFKEAAFLFGEVAGPFPIGPFKELSVRGRQLALFEKDTPYIIDGEDETDIEFVVLDPLPVVKVSVNGSKPVNFFIDTGGEEIILDRNFAKEIGAIIVGEVPQEYAGGKKGLTGYGKINTLSIGGMLVKNIPVSTIDLQPTFKKAGVAMDWSKADMGGGGGGIVKGLNVEIDGILLGIGDNKIVKHNIKGVVFENDISIFNGQLGFKVGGLVSHQVFRDYALTFNFNKMKLVLH